MQTITGELRKWRLNRKDKVVEGYMYNDMYAIWDEGELATVAYALCYEAATYYLIVTPAGKCYKLPKDEERKDAEGDGSSG